MTKRRPKGERATTRRPVPIRLGPAEWVVATILTVAAVSFQVLFLMHAGPLWRDEVNSAEFAGMPALADIVSFLPYDGFPLLSTLVVRGWIASGLGRSDFGLRILGLLVGFALLAALWFTSRRLRCRAPVASLALVALNPWVVSSVASIRPYGIGAVLIVLTLGLVWSVIEAPTAKRVLAAAALAVLGVQCMYQNAFLLLGILAAGMATALLTSRPRTAVALGAIGITAALSLLPYGPSIAAARAWNVVIQAPTTMKYLFTVFFEALKTGPVLQAWPWIALALAGLIAAARSLRARTGSPRSSPGGSPARQSPGAAIFGVSAAIATTVVFLAALRGTRLPTEPWYYVPLMATIAPALDAALTGASRDGARGALRVLLCSGIAVSAALSGWRPLMERRTNLDAVASYIGSGASEADVIVVYPMYYAISFQRYYKGPARCMTIPPTEGARIHRYDMLKSAMVQPNAIEPVLEAMAQALRSGHRVWLVGGLPNPDLGKPAPTLPPAPTAPSGWYCGPYLVTWGQQASHFLGSRALRGDPVAPLGKGPINPYEHVPLVVVTGWR